MDFQVDLVNNQKINQCLENVKRNRLVFLIVSIFDAFSFLLKYLILSITFFYFNFSKSVFSGLVILLLTFYQLEVSLPMFRFVFELFSDLIINWFLQFENVIFLIAFLSRFYFKSLELIALTTGFFCETFNFLKEIISRVILKSLDLIFFSINLLNEVTKYLYLIFISISNNSLSVLYLVFPYLFALSVISVFFFYCHKHKKRISSIIHYAVSILKANFPLFFQKFLSLFSIIYQNIKHVFFLFFKISGSIITFIYDDDVPENASFCKETVSFTEAVNNIDSFEKNKKTNSKTKHVSIDPFPKISYFDCEDNHSEDNQVKYIVREYQDIDEFVTLEQAKDRLNYPIEQFDFKFR